MSRHGSKGRYWCLKKETRVNQAKVFRVCLLRNCPHLQVRILLRRK